LPTLDDEVPEDVDGLLDVVLALEVELTEDVAVVLEVGLVLVDVVPEDVVGLLDIVLALEVGVTEGVEVVTLVDGVGEHPERIPIRTDNAMTCLFIINLLLK
jgi:hypothetical protein